LEASGVTATASSGDNHRRKKLTRKVSRAALAAGIAIGACGLVAVPAEAADTLYFVNAPAVTGAESLTPESATVTGAVDTGGAPGTSFSVAAGATLSWVGGQSILNTATKAETMSIDGLPTSGSDSNVVINGGTPSTVSNAGNDDFSDVEFEYDTLADYTANGDTPGDDTQYAEEVDVPTFSGLSSVSAPIGAFGLTAQNNTGVTPLTPGTKYVYWIVDQAGATDDAETVNTFNPASSTASTTVNPTYSCYPTAYIAENTYLKTLTTTGTVSGGITATGGPAQTAPQPEIQGPCVYFYGNLSGIDYYTSPTGEFATPAIGKLSVSSAAKVTATTKKGKILSIKKVTLPIVDKSAFKASGTIELTTSSGKQLATGKFGMQAGKTQDITLALTSAGKSAVESHAKTKLTLTSDWDQPTATKSVRL
jgi:hypothetical protein